MLLGAFLALVSQEIKAILAFSTLSQLGFFIAFYGLGHPLGIIYDFVHILNHSLYKGSLFLLAGIIYKATHITDIRQLGGLARSMPKTAFTFFIAAAAMAGLPGTTGFLSKELIITDLVGL